MTWISHIAVGTATAKFFGFNYYLAAFGSILPDLAERLLPGKVAHRGLTHSLALWSITLFLTWNQPQMRAVILGVCVGHLLMDSLTVTGVPVFDENSKSLTLFGGKIRTGKPGEYIIAGLIALVAFVLIGYSPFASIGAKATDLAGIERAGDHRQAGVQGEEVHAALSLYHYSI